MNNIGKTAFVMLALGFPVYLLWKGRLGSYLQLAGGSLLPVGSGAASGTATLGTTQNPTTYSPMGVPNGPVSANGLQNVPIPGL